MQVLADLCIIRRYFVDYRTASDRDTVSTKTSCVFVSDLHGDIARYGKLFHLISEEPPRLVFMGGDLLPTYLLGQSAGAPRFDDFVTGFLADRLEDLRRALGDAYPDVLLILGNDDLRAEESAVLAVADRGLWRYVHNVRVDAGQYPVYGYAYVPPTPFRLKDWERYDVSRFVDHGCVSPEEGARSMAMEPSDVKYGTIRKDLEILTANKDLSRAVFLFHAPPYDTALDRAALDAVVIDHAPVDPHVGSIAIRKFIELRQPLLTLHGHVHESARITGRWRERIGTTHAFSAAHDGPELAVVRFTLENLEGATRVLL